MTTDMTTEGPRTTQLRWGTDDDWDAVASLLKAVELPHTGVQEALKDYLLLVQPGAKPSLVACAGIVRSDHVALIRSVAVQPQLQGQGFGSMLVRRLLGWARQQRLRKVYLLTCGEAAFFASLGFVPAGALPGGLQGEAKAACIPCGDEAETMVLELT